MLAVVPAAHTQLTDAPLALNSPFRPVLGQICRFIARRRRPSSRIHDGINQPSRTRRVGGGWFVWSTQNCSLATRPTNTQRRCQQVQQPTLQHSSNSSFLRRRQTWHCWCAADPHLACRAEQHWHYPARPQPSLPCVHMHIEFACSWLNIDLAGLLDQCWPAAGAGPPLVIISGNCPMGCQFQLSRPVPALSHCRCLLCLHPPRLLSGHHHAAGIQ